jgi:SAM-dependent methyltransferase
MNEGKSFDSELPIEKRFGFGKNWSRYIDSHFNETRLDGSITVFREFTSKEVLGDASFLDIGCGSGLHSLAAFKMGAKAIVSFDFDLDAVQTTLRLKAMVGTPANWKVVQGSILDETFVTSLGKFNFVYSWGVLHHTGAVWKAIADYWLATKEKYVNSSRIKKIVMEQSYLLKNYYPSLLKGYLARSNNKEESRKRGMELMTDVRDWLGGWPMEFVLDDEVVNYVENLGYKLSNIKKGEACTEFLFTKID